MGNALFDGKDGGKHSGVGVEGISKIVVMQTDVFDG